MEEEKRPRREQWHGGEMGEPERGERMWRQGFSVKGSQETKMQRIGDAEDLCSPVFHPLFLDEMGRQHREATGNAGRY